MEKKVKKELHLMRFLKILLAIGLLKMYLENCKLKEAKRLLKRSKIQEYFMRMGAR